MPALKLITTIPPFVSPEEHATIVGSTPGSFAEIPAVLRHKEENVTVSVEPQLEGTAFGTEGVKGTLCVLTSVLVFIPESASASQGFVIEYPAITLHAVSRGESGPSIYCQLDETYGGPAPSDAVVNGGSHAANGTEGNDEDEEADQNDDTPMRELTIVPQNPASLEPIFEALSHCASLHPDPLSDDEGNPGGDLLDDSDAAFIDSESSPFETFTGDPTEELSEVGRAALEYMESIISDPHNLVPKTETEETNEDAFEDAEPEREAEATVKK